MDDHFRVACRPKSVSPAFQFFLKGLIVINLSVEDSGDAPIFVRDRLLSTIQIDDAQAPHSQRDVLVKKHTGIIRSPMMQYLKHAGQNLLVHTLVSFVFVDAADATHSWVPGLV